MYGLRTSSDFSISTTRMILTNIINTRQQDKGMNDAYMDRPEARTMPGGHILVEALDSIGSRKFTELLVHVMRPGARIVTQPNAEVFHLQGFLLVNL